MKKLAFIGALAFVLLSCKCKKAVTEVDSVKNTVSANTVMNVDSSSGLVTNFNDSSQMQETGIVAEYSANTRGYHLRIKLTPNELSYTNQRDSNELTKVALTDAQKAELQKLLKEIKAEKINELKAPTEKRFYDGAAHADLTITINGKSYNSAGFDHGAPPVEIQKFVSKLISYAKMSK